jgi:hypothetical protein
MICLIVWFECPELCFLSKLIVARMLARLAPHTFPYFTADTHFQVHLPQTMRERHRTSRLIIVSGQVRFGPDVLASGVRRRMVTEYRLMQLVHMYNRVSVLVHLYRWKLQVRSPSNNYHYTLLVARHHGSTSSPPSGSRLHQKD